MPRGWPDPAASPNSRLAISLVAFTATATPTAAPTSVTTSTSLSTSRSTSVHRAPSAMRMPSSRNLCVTSYETTPKMPRQASSTPTRLNTPVAVARARGFAMVSAICCSCVVVAAGRRPAPFADRVADERYRSGRLDRGSHFECHAGCRGRGQIERRWTALVHAETLAVVDDADNFNLHIRTGPGSATEDAQPFDGIIEQLPGHRFVDDRDRRRARVVTYPTNYVPTVVACRAFRRSSNERPGSRPPRRPPGVGLHGFAPLHAGQQWHRRTWWRSLRGAHRCASAGKRFVG